MHVVVAILSQHVVLPKNGYYGDYLYCSKFIAGKCADARKHLSSLVDVAAVTYMWPCLSCVRAAIADWSTWVGPPHQVWRVL